MSRTLLRISAFVLVCAAADGASALSCHVPQDRTVAEAASRYENLVLAEALGPMRGDRQRFRTLEVYKGSVPETFTAEVGAPTVGQTYFPGKPALMGVRRSGGEWVSPVCPKYKGGIGKVRDHLVDRAG